MERSQSQTLQHVITIESSPTALKKIRILVITNICALLNSNGGQLIIAFPNQNYETKELDQPVRTIEQWINNLTGAVTMSRKVKFHLSPHQISINVKGSEELITANYNMFLPSHTQVNKILPVEKLNEIQDALFEITTANNELPTVQQVFVRGEEIELIETYNVQFKQLENTGTFLADRVVGNGNKLIQCLSAFANYCGGTIYVGVDDKQHKINGQIIHANERETIIKKVKNKIDKMIWLGLEDGPQKGENWDIYFYPVVDKDGKHIESTFLIVIVVARCPGGVFLEEPESHHIVNGSVVRMRLSTWKEYLVSNQSRKETRNLRRKSAESASSLQMQCQLHVGRSRWSSIGKRKKYEYVNGVLIRMINDGSWKGFWKRLKMEQMNCSGGGIKLVILLMQITANYKKGKFEQAQLDMEEYKEGLSKSEDEMISETRLLLLKSSVERCKGNIKESYEQAKNGLALAEQIPAGIVVGEYYANFGTVITILLEQEHDVVIKKLLMREAIVFFQRALEHLDIANDYPPSKFDQKQKVHVNLAFLHLECSFASETKAESRVEDAAIDEAKNSLNAVDQCVHEGYALSDYRHSQYLLARSLLFYRRSQNLEEDESEEKARLLESALKFACDAKEKAAEFAEMLECTSKHIDFFKRLSDCNITECVMDE